MADYGYFKDSKGNKKYINDDSIYHEGKVLKDVIDAKANSADVYTKTETDTKLNAKANSSDVYTKEYMDNNLLPIFEIPNLEVSDSQIKATKIETNNQYVFINSHIFNRELVIISIFQDNLNIDRIINTRPTDLTSFTLDGNQLIIRAATSCKGKLYKLSYQKTG